MSTAAPIRAPITAICGQMKVFVFGGLGAVLNCIFVFNSLSYSVEEVVNDSLVRPYTVILYPAIVGFIIGTIFLLCWSFLKTLLVRSLLQYNGWLLNPKRPINKVWFLIMLLLLGKKNLGGYNYQQYLPSLPVPSLNKTCKRYLESVRPLLTDDKYRETEKIVCEFKKNKGKKLQIFLWFWSMFHRNWISDWWDEYIYMRQRTPIPISSNFFSLGTKYPTTPNQLDRAAMLLHYAAKFLYKFESGKIPSVVTMQVAPFCMSGVSNAFRCSRIPGHEVDTFKKSYSSTHSVVWRQGKFYMVQVATSDNQVLSPSVIKKQLETIMELAGDEMDNSGLASFTALPREEWNEIRNKLIEDENNKYNLDVISDAISMVYLESNSPPIDDLTARGRHMFHGDIHNRWFDKAISVAVYPNGLTGANVEHSHLDATVCAQVWEYMLQREEYDHNGIIIDNSTAFTTTNISGPIELKWNLEHFTDDLKRAKDNLSNLIDDSDLIIVSPSYGKNIPKQCKLSPDGWFQMAIQLAYYRMYNKLVLTYESATTRLYYKGRTETIRPVSIESKRFVQSMDDPSASVEECKGYLKAAIQYQEKYKFEAMRGMGVDRHLFGLYIIAKWLKMDPMPELFQDEAFQLKFHLSTSQTPVQVIRDDWSLERCNCVGGFGTVTDIGYGVSYLTWGEEEVYYSIHCKRSCPTTDSKEFGEAIKKAFEDMRKLYIK